MIQLTRRNLLAGAAALGAAAQSAQAAAPMGGKQAPSFYRLKVGDLEVTTFSDGTITGPVPQTMVRNVPPEEVSRALEAAYFPKGQVTNQFNPTLVNTGGKLVLLDTGNGAGRSPTTGMLASGLAAAGVDPKAVDVVVISHFHQDHIGGLRTADGALTYPNAEIMVPDAEWAFWMDDGNMSRAPAEGPVRNTFNNVRRIFGPNADKVTRYERGKDVAPGIVSMPTSGHTPGHTSFVVGSGTARLIVQADLTGNPVINLNNPGWHTTADMDGPMAEATRRKVFDMAAADRTPIVGYHYPFPGVGYIEKAGDRYRLVPVSWNPTL
jgi:glyoxylase-like metal-dependent hydrolase (beta-lactamase superfamily II)